MQARGRAFTADDALGMRSLGYYSRPTFSLDGALLAYVVQTPVKEISKDNIADVAPRFASGTDIWIADIEDKSERSISNRIGSSWGPTWAPDGSALAFFSTRDGSLAVWIWSRSTNNLRKVSRGKVQARKPLDEIRWTADGKYLLYPSSISSDVTSRRSPAGKAVEVLTSPLRANTKLSVPYIDPPPAGSSQLIDLVLARVEDGFEQVIVKNSFVVNYWISPNGEYLAYTLYKGSVVGTPQLSTDINVCSLKSYACRVLVSDVVMDNLVLNTPVNWSPDSRKLAYVANGQFQQLSRTESWNARRGDCYIAAIDGASPINVTPEAHPPFENATTAPLWDPAGKSIYVLASTLRSADEKTPWSVDALWVVDIEHKTLSKLIQMPDVTVLGVVSDSQGRSVAEVGQTRNIVVAVQNEETRRSGLLAVDRFSGATLSSYESAISLGSAYEIPRYLSADHKGHSIAYVSGSSTEPLDIWVTDSTLKQRERVSHINPQIAGNDLGSATVLRYSSLDGDPLYAALVKPAGYVPGKRYPLIVWVYSGTFMSKQVFRFGVERGDSSGASLNVQVLASAGYAVLVPDAPLKEGTAAHDLLKSIMPAVDAAIEIGVADPNLCGVFGHSFGGYGSLALITQTSRFKAAVAYASISDLISVYGSQTEWAESGQGHLGGTPWQYRERYIENSPVFYLDRVATPLLLIHGEKDGVPISQAKEVFAGLKRLGKSVVFVKYKDEGHIIDQPSNVVDFWERVLSFFEVHLKHAPN